jgi:hypothetical protein
MSAEELTFIQDSMSRKEVRFLHDQDIQEKDDTSSGPNLPEINERYVGSNLQE